MLVPSVAPQTIRLHCCKLSSVSASSRPSLQALVRLCKLSSVSASSRPSLQALVRLCKLSSVSASSRPSLQALVRPCKLSSGTLLQALIKPHRKLYYSHVDIVATSLSLRLRLPFPSVTMSPVGMAWCTACNGNRPATEFRVPDSGKLRKTCLRHLKKRKLNDVHANWSDFMDQIRNWNVPEQTAKLSIDLTFDIDRLPVVFGGRIELLERWSARLGHIEQSCERTPHRHS